jgi:hypothetical protein
VAVEGVEARVRGGGRCHGAWQDERHAGCVR